MGLSMKERNDKTVWAAYEKEGQILIEEACRRREEISEKHKNDPHHPGMDGSPEAKEAGEVTRWFGREIKKLREKHGIK